jgi:hypothetical protein
VSGRNRNQNVQRVPELDSRIRVGGGAVTTGQHVPALNLFHIEPLGMVPADVDAAQALADVATIAILQHRAALQAHVLNQQLEYALNSRIAIEQAKGMVAERDSVNMEEAFLILRNHARNHNVRLAQVAEDLISGTLTASALDRT